MVPAETSLGLDRHGDQGGFGDGGTETYAEGEQIGPAVIAPVDFADAIRTDKGGIGQLLGHHLAQWKQRFLQPQQKQRQADQYVDEADDDGFRVADPAANHQQLKAQQDPYDGNHIPEGIQQGREQRRFQHAVDHPIRVP